MNDVCKTELDADMIEPSSHDTNEQSSHDINEHQDMIEPSSYDTNEQSSHGENENQDMIEPSSQDANEQSSHGANENHDMIGQSSHETNGRQECLIRCQLCSNDMHFPKTLPCLHSFCETCLEDYIEKEKARSGRPSIACPSCDNMVVIPRGKGKTREYVEQLPINTLVSTILSKSGKYTRTCRDCKQDLNGTGNWCCYCARAFCDEHIKNHVRVTSRKHVHPTVKLGEAGTNISKINFPYEKCPYHSKEDMDIFCKKEWTPCCQACCKTMHNKCDTEGTIFPMSVAAMNVKDSEHATKLKENLETLRKDTENSAMFFIVHLAELQVQQDTIKENISKMRKSVNEHVNNLEGSLQRELGTIYENTRKDLEECKDSADINCSTLLLFLRLMENIPIHLPDIQAIFEISRIREQTKKIESDLHTLKSKARIVEISVGTHVDYFIQITRMGTIHRRTKCERQSRSVSVQSLTYNKQKSKQETIQNHNGSQKELNIPQEEVTRQQSEIQNNIDKTKDNENTDKYNCYKDGIAIFDTTETTEDIPDGSPNLDSDTESSGDEKEADKFSFLKCQLCSEDIHTPKMLQCLHSFCEACLSRDMTSQLDRSKAIKYTCPSCSSVIVISRGRFNVKQFVESLHTNALISIMFSKRAVKTRRCNDCKNDANHAIYWCSYCARVFCVEHFKYHKSLASINHRKSIIFFNDLCKNQYENPVSYQKCRHHKKENLDLFCKKEWTPCCRICRKMIHPGCDRKGNVVPISVAAMTMKEGEHSKILKKNLETLREEAKSVSKDFGKNLEELEVDLRQSKESVVNSRDCINGHLNNLEDELSDELKRTYERTRTELEFQRDKADVRFRKVIHYQEMIEKIYIHSSETHALMELSKLRIQTENLKSDIHTSQMKSRTFELSLQSYIKYFKNIKKMGVIQRHTTATCKWDTIDIPV